MTLLVPPDGRDRLRLESEFALSRPEIFHRWRQIIMQALPRWAYLNKTFRGMNCRAQSRYESVPCLAHAADNRLGMVA